MRVRERERWRVGAGGSELDREKKWRGRRSGVRERRGGQSPLAHY